MTLPKVLDAIADKVLRYRPKPKSKPARRRKRQAAKLEKVAWCPFCKKEHAGGATCMGHYP